MRCSKKGKFDTCVNFAISWAILMSHKKIDSLHNAKAVKSGLNYSLNSKLGYVMRFSLYALSSEFILTHRQREGKNEDLSNLRLIRKTAHHLMLDMRRC